jgi:hypothetical protein
LILAGGVNCTYAWLDVTAHNFKRSFNSSPKRSLAKAKLFVDYLPQRFGGNDGTLPYWDESFESAG